MNACALLLGRMEGYKEFAWMWPHLRCRLLDEIEPYKLRLAHLMQEALQLQDHLFPSELYQKLQFGKLDMSFLMNCAMIYKIPVMMDERPENNLP